GDLPRFGRRPGLRSVLRLRCVARLVRRSFFGGRGGWLILRGRRRLGCFVQLVNLARLRFHRRGRTAARRRFFRLLRRASADGGRVVIRGGVRHGGRLARIRVGRRAGGRLQLAVRLRDLLIARDVGARGRGVLGTPRETLFAAARAQRDERDGGDEQERERGRGVSQ